MPERLGKRSFLRNLTFFGLGFGVRRYLFAAITLLSGSIRTSASDTYRILVNSVSPNRRFGLAISKVTESQQERNEDGVVLDESLFIVDLVEKRIVREVSGDYRRASASPWPEYKGVWSTNSTHLAAIARFRRNSAIEGYALRENEWTNLNFPRFDPLNYMKTALKSVEPSTTESEVLTAEWKEDSELSVQARAYLKIDRPVEMTIIYVYELRDGKWQARVVNSSERSE